MSAETWPPSLKDWVAKCLGQMTDSNRAEAQAELKQVIADAFSDKTLWTTDWAGVQLQSLAPKPAPFFNGLKRKTNDNPPTPKKVKINNNVDDAPPTPDDLAALSRRAQRFSREHTIERDKKHGGRRNAAPSIYSRAIYSGSAFDDDPEGDPNVPNWDRHTIVGTSTEIFKDYLRLTSEPKPEQIRPYQVLRESLTQLKQKWRQKASYNWICSQFKSLRQDLTVQRIKNDFTVSVYEIHARMALEVSDMVEYNACQSMLKSLYEVGIPGKVDEFTAYRILLLLHGLNRSELNLYVAQLTLSQKSTPAVRHALAVQRALAMGNYHALFQLYVDCPNMGAYIMDHFIDRERTKAIMVISKAYQKIPLAFVTDILAFENATAAVDFLTDHNSNFFANPNAPDPEKILECRPCGPAIAKAYEDKKYAKAQIKGRI